MMPCLCTYLYIADDESATTNQVYPTLLVYPLGIMGGVSGALLVALAANVCVIVVLLCKGKYKLCQKNNNYCDSRIITCTQCAYDYAVDGLLRVIIICSLLGNIHKVLETSLRIMHLFSVKRLNADIQASKMPGATALDTNTYDTCRVPTASTAHSCSVTQGCLNVHYCLYSINR